MKLFQCRDYREFIRIQLQKNKGRGYHGLCAKAAGCKSSYLSQVLSGSAHLTPDHASGLCYFWGLSDLESEYFMSLVDYGRAGTPLLKQRLARRMIDLKRKNENLAARFAEAHIVDDEMATLKYYSAWHFAALHVALGVPELQTVAALARRFMLPESIVEKHLKFLGLIQLAAVKNGRWQSLRKDVHLPRDSFMSALAHRNWRELSMSKTVNGNPDDLFFSGVYTLSREDFHRVRERLMDTLHEIRNVMSRSQDEDVYALVCDWFRL